MNPEPQTQVEQWRLLGTQHQHEHAHRHSHLHAHEHEHDAREHRAHPMFSGDPGGCLARVCESACRAMHAAVAGRRSERGREGAVIAAELRSGLQQLHGLLTEERRRHYGPTDSLEASAGLGTFTS
jgi:ABC-type nickel/cobalt efflux system permease component RcnA